MIYNKKLATVNNNINFEVSLTKEVSIGVNQRGDCCELLEVA